jgi:DNA primase
MKYSYDPGNQQHLYNAQTLIDADVVVVTEGELDAISVEQAGLPAVAYPGASTWQKMRHWPHCFDSVREVVVVADGDEPGVKAATTVTESLRRATAADVRLVLMPPGFDANAFLLAYSESDFLELLEWL